MNLDSLQELLNEAEDAIRRAKSEIARLLNGNTTVPADVTQAAKDSATTTSATVTEDTPAEPAQASGPEVEGTVEDTTGDQASPEADGSQPVDNTAPQNTTPVADVTSTTSTSDNLVGATAVDPASTTINVTAPSNG